MAKRVDFRVHIKTQKLYRFYKNVDCGNSRINIEIYNISLQYFLKTRTVFQNVIIYDCMNRNEI